MVLVAVDRARELARRLAPGLCAVALAACSSAPKTEVDDKTEEKQLEDARQYFAAGDLSKAEDATETLLETTRDPKRKQEALFLAAEVHYADQEYVKAFRHYQALVHDYPYSSFVPRCEDHIYAIGVEYLSRSRWFFFGDLFSGRERGAEVMREFAATFPSSSKADDALAALAGYRYSRKEFDQAATFYAQLARKYPDSEWADLAAYRRADCWRLHARGAGYDITPLLKAVVSYRRYLSERPNGEHRGEAQEQAREVDEMLARSELLKAELYVARENEPGARIHYANVALAYPTTQAAEIARRELAAKGQDLSQNSVGTLSLPPSTDLDE